jgi:hypothetical protein
MSKFAEQIAANRAARERNFIDVDEWGAEGNPLRIYYTAVTGSDIDKVSRKYKDFTSNPSIAGMVEMIIIKAQTEDGEKMFSLDDKPTLLREPIGVLTNVFGVVFNAVSVEEQEKN